jgi:hypothetical protein
MLSLSTCAEVLLDFSELSAMVQAALGRGFSDLVIENFSFTFRKYY